MWRKVEQMFGGLPGQKAVVRKMIELGLGISENGKVRCGDVEIKENR